MQPLHYRLAGWVRLVLDTLVQRAINASAATGQPLLCGPPAYQPLRGRTAVVTGANTGLGLETARWLAARGATVVLACRSPAKAAAAAAALRTDVPGARVEVAALDLADLASVRAFAAAFAPDPAAPRPLHILVLNAGVMCVPLARPETHFSVNHVAHALLALLLLPSLAAARAAHRHARVVFVSSLALVVSQLNLDDVGFRRRRYDSFAAYANSKLCNVLFMRALVARLHGSGISCRAVHPGESTTDVARNLGSFQMAVHKRIVKVLILTPAEAARSIVHAAVAGTGVSGCDDMGDPLDLIHAVKRTLHVPDRLVTPGDVELLWLMTLIAAQVTEEEKALFCKCGLRDEPLYAENGDPVVESGC